MSKSVPDPEEKVMDPAVIAATQENITFRSIVQKWKPAPVLELEKLYDKGSETQLSIINREESKLVMKPNETPEQLKARQERQERRREKEEELRQNTTINLELIPGKSDVVTYLKQTGSSIEEFDPIQPKGNRAKIIVKKILDTMATYDKWPGRFESSPGSTSDS